MSGYVLFNGDINKYPNATYHVETKNTSFIYYANVLRKMGIKNNAFVLTLLDPDLALVDPFNPGSTEIANKVATECALNPWYGLREIIRTPEDGSYLTANRGLISFFWLFLNSIPIIQTQPRQTGKTLTLNSCLAELAQFIYENSTINVITLNEKLRDETSEKLKKMFSFMPQYLNFRTNKDTDVSEQIKIGLKNNVIRFWLPRSDVVNARNVCRGSSGSALFGDETPFQPNVDVSWPAAQNSCNAEFVRMERMGKPYGDVMLTTAGVVTTRSGEFVYRLIERSAVFNETFFDVPNRDALCELISRRSDGSLRVYSEFNALQLGVDENIFRKNVKNNTGNKAQIAMEMFNKWQTGDKDNTLTAEERSRALLSEKEPCFIEIDPKTMFSINWYVPKSELTHYLNNGSFVMVLDMAEGRGGDDITITIIDVSNAEVIGEGDINIVNTFNFTVYMGQWFMRMPRMVFVPEAKSLGIVVIDYLLDYLPTIGQDPLKRIFNWLVNNRGLTTKDDERYFAAAKVSKNSRELRAYQKEFGYATSGTGRASRDNLYNKTLRDFIRIAIDKMRSSKLIYQLINLKTVNGRIDHEDGNHDDKVIGWLLGGWFLLFARNKDLYSIDANRVFENVVFENEKEISEDEYYIREENKKINALIQERVTALKEAYDEFEAKRIENEIRFLAKRINNNVGGPEPINIDDLIKSATNAFDYLQQENDVPDYARFDPFSRFDPMSLF